MSTELAVPAPQGEIVTFAEQSDALAALEQSFALAVRQRELLESYIRERLQPDRHFYTVSGSNKPGLTKEGAELVCLAHGLKPRYEIISGPECPPDDDSPYQITARCTLGQGEGLGSAGSHKRRRDGTYGMRQPDRYLCHNATLKMAQKSAYIAATLNATAASEFFTQDMDDDAKPGADPQQAPANGSAVPACPVCSGPMYDNRQDNDKREADGKKLGPDWKCKAYKSANCEGVYWRGQWPPKAAAEPPEADTDPRVPLLLRLKRDLGQTPAQIMQAITELRGESGPPCTDLRQSTVDELRVVLRKTDPLRQRIQYMESSETLDHPPDPDEYERLAELVAEHAESDECRAAFQPARNRTGCTAQGLDKLLNRRTPQPGDVECLKAILGALGVDAS